MLRLTLQRVVLPPLLPYRLYIAPPVPAPGVLRNCTSQHRFL